MSMKKQIEEMARVVEITEQIARDAVGALPSPRMYARDLYEKGYRKQEWISVEERLPKTSGSYIVCTDKGGVCTAHFYADCGRFNAPFGKSVVYWTDLPEPPKGE